MSESRSSPFPAIISSAFPTSETLEFMGSDGYVSNGTTRRKQAVSQIQRSSAEEVTKT